MLNWYQVLYEFGRLRLKRIEMNDSEGRSLFGAIDQRYVQRRQVRE
jgi:hypothetical protein